MDISSQVREPLIGQSKKNSKDRYPDARARSLVERDVNNPKPKPIEELLRSCVPNGENPIPNMNIIEKFFFMWVNPLFDKGSSNKLQPTDLFKIPAQNKASEVGKQFDQFNKDHPENDEMSNVFKTIRPVYIRTTLIFIMGSLAQMLAPLLFNQYIVRFQLTENGEHAFMAPVLIILLIVVDLLVRQVLVNQAMFHLGANGTRVAITLRHLIFTRLKNMSIVHKNYFVETTLVNLMTIDIDNVTNGLIIIPNFLAAACLLIAQFYYLYALGYLTVVLFLLLLFVIFLLSRIHKNTKIARLKLLKCTDFVSKVIKEFITNIVSVKIARFEHLFYKKLIDHKTRESAAYRTYLRWSQLAGALNFIFPTIFGLIFFSLTVEASHGKKITLAETYLVLTVLSIMRTPLNMINDGFDRYPDYRASRTRIEAFLHLVRPKEVLLNKAKSINQSQLISGTIHIRNCCFGLEDPSSSSPKKHSTPLLESITLDIPPGTKVAIVGTTGSGKTFLLLSMLGETTKLSGDIEVAGIKVFLPKDPLYFEDSIFQNIVCGVDYDPKRYKEIMAVLKLDELISHLREQDRFILKNNGSNLLSKLRKRILLARLLYREADIYLIDGALNERDEDFREYFMSEVVKKRLKDKTVVITTDRHDICEQADLIVVMSDCRIVEKGSFSQLACKKDSLFCTLMGINEHTAHTKLVDPIGDTLKKKQVAFERIKTVHRHDYASEADIVNCKLSNRLPYPPVRTDRRWSVVFKQFFFNQGFALPLAYVTLIALSQTMIYTFTWFIAEWKSKAFKFTPLEYVELYGGIVMLAVVFVAASSLVFIHYFRKISFRLFLMIVRNMVSNDLAWFKKFPASKLLNVFITDYNEVDQLLGPSLQSFLQNLIRINIGLFFILYKTYLMGTTIVFFHLLILYTMKKFLRTDRALKQIIVRKRAHMVTFLMDIQRGLIHYRNSGLMDNMEYVFFSIHDIYQNAKTADGNFAQRWLSARLLSYAMAYPVLVLLDAVFKVILDIELDYTLHSLKFTIALDMCFSMMPLLTSFVKNETYYCDIERIIDYAGGRPNSESKLKANLLHVPDKSRGVDFSQKIRFENITLVYPDNLKKALNNVSFEIHPGERIALVGTAGSGKFNIINLLAGTLLPDMVKSGRIMIGRLDCTQFMLEFLGGEVCLLNSEYTPFEADLRTNIDPNNQYLDEDIVSLFFYLGFWNLTSRHSPDDKFFTKIIKEFEGDAGVDTAREVATSYSRRRSIVSFRNEDSVLEEGIERKARRLRGIKRSMHVEIDNSYDIEERNALKYPKKKIKEKKWACADDLVIGNYNNGNFDSINTSFDNERADKIEFQLGKLVASLPDLASKLNTLKEFLLAPKSREKSINAEDKQQDQNLLYKDLNTEQSINKYLKSLDSDAPNPPHLTPKQQTEDKDNIRLADQYPQPVPALGKITTRMSIEDTESRLLAGSGANEGKASQTYFVSKGHAPVGMASLGREDFEINTRFEGESYFDGKGRCSIYLGEIGRDDQNAQELVFKKLDSETLQFDKETAKDKANKLLEFDIQADLSAKLGLNSPAMQR